MSDSDPSKRKVDANATIQIDLDQVQLFDPNASAARATPPPLPTLPALPVAPQEAASSPAKTILYVALIVVLMGLAVVGGLAFAARARGGATAEPTTPATATSPAASAAAPGRAAAPSSSAPTLTMPTIEMH